MPATTSEMACRLFAGAHSLVGKCAERSSAWLEHLVWDQDVAGSNPVAPTIFSLLLRRAQIQAKNRISEVRPAICAACWALRPHCAKVFVSEIEEDFPILSGH